MSLVSYMYICTPSHTWAYTHPHTTKRHALCPHHPTYILEVYEITTFSLVQSCWEWSASAQTLLKKWLFWPSRAGSPFPVTLLAAQMASGTLKSMWKQSLLCLGLDTLPETVRDLGVQGDTVWQCGREEIWLWCCEILSSGHDLAFCLLEIRATVSTE